MRTLYLCGAGNVEGVRLALVVNGHSQRWQRILLLDDDSDKHGTSVLGIPVVGPFGLLGTIDPDGNEVANLVCRTTVRRRLASERIAAFGLPFASLIHPGVDTTNVRYCTDIQAFRNATLGADSSVGSGSVVLMGAVLGHGARLGRCCILAPNAVVNARVQAEDDVYVGANATILPDLSVGAGATIGACSAAMNDVPPGATVIGVPGRVLQIAGPKPGNHRSSALG